MISTLIFNCLLSDIDNITLSHDFDYLPENYNEKNAGELFMVNEKGYIAEGATSNIFFIKNNKIFK